MNINTNLCTGIFAHECAFVYTFSLRDFPDNNEGSGRLHSLVVWGRVKQNQQMLGWGYVSVTMEILQTKNFILSHECVCAACSHGTNIIAIICFLYMLENVNILIE